MRPLRPRTETETEARTPPRTARHHHHHHANCCLLCLLGVRAEGVPEAVGADGRQR